MRQPRFRLLAAAGVVAVAAAGSAPAAASAGTGTVVTTVTVSTVAGALTLTGTGVTVTISQVPGAWGTSVGATTLTMTDTTGTTNGWQVVATYSAPIAPTFPLTGANVEVSSGNVTPDPLGGVSASNVSTVTDVAMTAPVTVLSTGSNSGAGITTATTSLKVRVPQTAQLGQTYGCIVTYTIASVR